MIDQKVMLITGAHSGLGRKHAELFLERGFMIICIDIIKAEWMDDTESAISYVCDVRDRDGLKNIRDKILKKFGKIDVLINNAGVQGVWKQAIDVLPDENWDLNVSVNMTGTFNCTKIFGSTMMERGGSIVNIASMAGLAPMPEGTIAYSSTKAGIIMMTKCTAVEWGKYNIRTNCVCPGPFETEINHARYELPGMREARANISPLKRNGDPRELSEAIYFIASDKASLINGEILTVDGGMNLTTWVAFANL
ncbi:MAG: SDR family NAD(P)-dependent oxidoreductase [Christensenellales bacterium]|jgi:NAD(P)-dependent dehydrogenase (short-subunit alcohol dehydrogenase family)